MTNTQACREIIARSPWFEGAPDAALDKLAEAATIKSLPANSFIYTQGQKTTEVYCVVSGRLRFSVTSEMGHEFALLDREEDTWLGEPGLLGDAARVLDAKTLTQSDILVIPRHVMLEVADDWPLIYRNLFRHNATFIRFMLELVGGMFFYPLHARVAGRLLHLVEEHGQAVDGGMLIDIKISQADFARLALGSRQRVNRIFREWTRRGLVTTRDDHLLVRDIEALEQEVVPFD